MAPFASVTSTDFTYTGQRDLPGTGLMDYNARFYSPTLGRFTQPDTIIPNPANPQSFNRYSYVKNNPINFNDPSGHIACEYDDECHNAPMPTPTPPIPEEDDDDITITVTRDELNELQNVADELASYYETAGDWWGYGTGAVASAGMLFVDGATCVVSGVFTLGTSCAIALVLTVEIIPLAAYTGSQLGGHKQADAYGVISEYFEDVLINSSEEQFTLRINQGTHTTVLLPGGVGPTSIEYTISIDGYTETTQVYNSYGNKAINFLLEGVP
jgi:RHS repeat-associated protein